MGPMASRAVHRRESGAIGVAGTRPPLGTHLACNSGSHLPILARGLEMMIASSVRRIALTLYGALLLVTALGVTPVGEAAPAAPVMAQTTVPNLAKAVLSSGWMSSCNRYERMQGVIVLSGSKAPV